MTLEPNFLKVNLQVVSSLTTESDLELDEKPTVCAGTSLQDLIDVGPKDQSVAPTILDVLLQAIGDQTFHPVLLAVDDFHALYC